MLPEHYVSLHEMKQILPGFRAKWKIQYLYDYTSFIWKNDKQKNS